MGNIGGGGWGGRTRPPPNVLIGMVTIIKCLKI